MKIIFILANYYPYIGGAENAAKNLAEGLVNMGHEVTVVTSQYDTWELEESINGVQIIRIKTPRLGKQFIFNFYSLTTLIKICGNFDLIYTASNYSALAAIIVSKIFSLVSNGKPIILYAETLIP